MVSTRKTRRSIPSVTVNTDFKKTARKANRQPVVTSHEENITIEIDQSDNQVDEPRKEKVEENDEDSKVDVELLNMVQKATSDFKQCVQSSTSETSLVDSTHSALDIAQPNKQTASKLIDISGKSIVQLHDSKNKKHNLEFSSKLISKSILNSTVNDTMTDVEKKADLIGELYSSTTATLSTEIKKPKKDTAGKGWFDLPATPLTDELKMDFHIIKNRSVLDPKQQYSRDKAPIPKYFQVATVIEGATGFLNDRIAKRDRRQTIAQEVLEDLEAKSYLKKRIVEKSKRAPVRFSYNTKKQKVRKAKDTTLFD